MFHPKPSSTDTYEADCSMTESHKSEMASYHRKSLAFPP